MLLDNTNGLSNLFEFKKNHFNSSFKQKMNLKIQILAGSTLMSRFHVSFEIELPLERGKKCNLAHTDCLDKINIF